MDALRKKHDQLLLSYWKRGIVIDMPRYLLFVARIY